MRTISGRLFLLMMLINANPFIFAQEGAYVNNISVNQGDTLKFYINTSSNPFTLKISRFLTSSNTQTIVSYNNIAGGLRSVPSDAYISGCGWPESFRIVIPQSWEPGVYRATFPTSLGGGGVLFFVKPPNAGSFSKTLVVLNTNTWQAYNAYGGESLYPSSTAPRSYKVSFQRPSTHQYGAYYFFQQEVKFVDWLAVKGKKPEFLTDYDIHTNQSILQNYDVVVVAGHGEYWSWEERNAFQQYVNNGGKLMILAGNTCWWQSRFEDNGNTLVCYKDRNLDPLKGVADSLVTVNWYAQPVYNPENPLTGLSFRSSGYVNNNSTLPASDGYGDYAALNTHHWVYRNTGLNDGDEYGYNSQIVGNETDGAVYNWNNGLPNVTGTDGTPLNYRILGLSPSLSASGVWGHAVPGIYYNSSGGVVFNTASIKWVNGLASDNIVQTITDNVYSRFLNHKFPPDIISASPYKTDTLVVNKENLLVNRREITLNEGESLNFNLNAVDPQNGQISYKWYVNNNIISSEPGMNFTAGVDSLYIVKGVSQNNSDSSWLSWTIHVNKTGTLPLVPLLTSPADNTTLNSYVVNFKWDSSSGAQFYKIQVAADSTFTSLIVNDSLSATGLTADLSGSGYQFFWRVRSGNNIGYSDYSSIRKFNIELPPVLPAIPVLVSPADSTILNSYSVTFQWDSAQYATKYNLQVASDTAFTTLVINDTTATLSLSKNLSGSGSLFYWRVRGGNDNGFGQFSVNREFSIVILMEIPPAPVPISPADSTILNSYSVTFQWDSAQYATKYNLQVASDTAFTALVINDTTATLSLSKNLSGSGSLFYWRVRGGNDNGFGQFSVKKGFSIVILPGIPAAPVLISPADSSILTNSNITFNWDSVQNANKYNLQVASDSAFSSLVLNDTLTAKTYNSNLPGSGILYFWRVRALNISGAGNFSQSRRFTILLPPPVPGLISPANNASFNNPLVAFQWDSLSQVQYYIIQVASDSLFSNLVVRDSLITNKKSADLTGKGALFFWRVQAGNTAGKSSFSNFWKFNITLPPPGPVTLISPLRNQKNVPLNTTFKWNKASGTSYYVFVLSTDKNLKTIVIKDSSLTINDTTRIVNDLQPKKNYWWRVTAKNLSGATNSEIRQFTTGSTTAPAGNVISVYAMKLNSDNYRISWSSNEDFYTTHYEVEKKFADDSWKTVFSVPAESSPGHIYDYDVQGEGLIISVFRITSYYRDGTAEISAEITPSMVISDFVLQQNYPNPFNPETNIEYFLPQQADVRLVLYSITGEEVRTLVNSTQDAGYYKYSLNASGLSTGVYFYKLTATASDGAHSYSSVKKMILLK